MENITQGQFFSASASGDLGTPINDSLLFDGNHNGLVRTLGNAVSTATISFWFKPLGRDVIESAHDVARGYLWRSGGGNSMYYQWDASDNGKLQNASSADVSATGYYRDITAWYHMVYQISGTTHKIWINGVRRNSDQTLNSPITASDFVIGNHSDGATNLSNRWRGQMAQFIMVDGTAVAPTEFGRFQENGIWVPKSYSGSYGTEGFRLDFSDSSDLGNDTSGNNNDFTASGFETTALSNSNPTNDVDSSDTPTNNKPVVSLEPHYGDVDDPHTFRYVSGTYCTASGPIAYPDTGVWQTEYYSLTGYITIFGFRHSDSNINVSAEAYTGVWGVVNNGTFTANGTNTGGQVNSTSNGDIWTLIMDMDNDEAKWYRNNTLEYTLSIPARNDKQYYPFFQGYQNNNEINFGQFPFRYSPNANAKALISANLPEPTIKTPEDHFFVKLWTGTGSSQDIDGIPFQPDLVWNKAYSPNAYHHRIFDSVRGAENSFSSDENFANSGSTSGSLTSFNSDGFTWGGTGYSYNVSGQSHVSWCWKAGGAPTTDNSNSAGSAQTAGSVKIDGANGSMAAGTLPVVRASVNTEAGFSIIRYTGNGSSGTVPHGLGKAPHLIITKSIPNTYGWSVYHRAMNPTDPADYYMNLNVDNGKYDASNRWNDTMPTSTVFTVGSHQEVNYSQDYIAYCWAPIAGYSAMGHHRANNNTNGPFHYCGFKPAYVVIKCHSVNGDPWYIWDNKRVTDHGKNNKVLAANSTITEATSDSYSIELLNNGFKLRNSGGATNYSTREHVWWAFAEHPTGGENFPPMTAF